MTRLEAENMESGANPGEDPVSVFGGTQLSYRREHGYLRVVCRGDFPLRPYVDLLTAIRAEATRMGESRILVDAFAVSAPASGLDRFWFGSAVAELFYAADFKVALLVPSDRIDKLGENTAVNRGARLLVVGD